MSSRRSTFRKLLPLIVLILVVIFLYVNHHSTNIKGDSTQSSNLPSSNAPAGSQTLITEPGAGAEPVVSLINNAKKSVDLVIYELEDPNIVQALVAAHTRGVQVRVLLNGGYYGTPDKHQPNKPAYDLLQSNGVPVRYTPNYFALTHQKTLVVDNSIAVVMTFNLVPKYYASGRDFGVIDKDARDVAAIENTFSADWQSRKITATAGDDLLWSPGSEAATVDLIGQAKKSVQVYNEEMADKNVVSALGSAAMRGVDVRIVMTDQRSWHPGFDALKADGARIHTFRGQTPLYIHAKVIVVDGKKAFVGSENFSITSLQRNRELGIIVADPTILQSLQTTFAKDYQIATPY